MLFQRDINRVHQYVLYIVELASLFLPGMLCVSILIGGRIWLSPTILIFYITIPILAIFLNRLNDPKAAFLLCVLVFPALSPAYCILTGGEYFSLNNKWLQFMPDINGQALMFLLVTVYLVWLLLKLHQRRERIKKYVYNNVELKKWSIIIYIIFIISFVCFFYLAEPGQTLFTADYETIIKQRIPGTQFAGGVGGIFFILSSFIYTFARKHHGSKWFVANTMFIVATLFSGIWLLIHARRSELFGMIAVYFFYLEKRRGRKLIIGTISLISLIVIGKIRDTVISLSSFSLAITNSQGVRAVKQALPGGASNVYLTFLDTIHYTLNNGISYGISLLHNLLGIIPTSILKLAGIQPFYYSTLLDKTYEYNGGLFFPSIFFMDFGFAGVIFHALIIYILVCIINKSEITSKISIKITAIAITFFCTKMFWYEPIGTLKFIVYSYLLGILTRYVFKVRRYQYPIKTTHNDIMQRDNLLQITTS